MQRLLLSFSFLKRHGAAFLGVLVWAGSAAGLKAAAPTNDLWASAVQLAVGTNLYGSIAGTTASATNEVGEPSHAGFPARASIWYKLTAPLTGEITLDTFGSATNTVLAVYTGSDVAHLTQVAANDDMYPLTQTVTKDFLSATAQPAFTLAALPFAGPSLLRFNATAGTTYYIAVDTKAGTGATALNWAYNPAGVFRFASEDYLGGIPTYQAISGEAGTESTYYRFGVNGVEITVTRVGGSCGRMVVDYTTADGTAGLFPNDTAAASGSDYVTTKGRLVFDDYEMTKSFVVPLLFPLPTDQDWNRDFYVMLTNVQPATLESGAVAPPRLDPANSKGLVHLLELNHDPNYNNNFDTNGNFTWTTNVVFNFTRKVYRFPRDLNSYWADMDILVMRGGTNEAGATLNYRINNYVGSQLDSAEEDNNRFPLQAGSDYATPTPPDSSFIRGSNSDFVLVQGTVTFGQNDNTIKHIHQVFVMDNRVKFNEDFHVFLYTLVNGQVKLVGNANECAVTILADNDFPSAGSVDQLHNPDHIGGMRFQAPFGGFDDRDRPGVDGPVYALQVQPDTNTIVAGQFTSFDGTKRNGIARLNMDGSLDGSFDPGDGLGDPDFDFISSMALMPDGHVVVAGSFSFFDFQSLPGVARLNSNGLPDPSFNQFGTGADDAIWAVCVQNDGKIVIGGDFASINGHARMRIARLNANGSLDTAFDLGTNGPDGTVTALALTPTGQILLGGSFAKVGGLSRNGVARLNSDGSLDTTFNPGTGADGRVYALALQADGRLLIGGQFTHFNLTARNRIARLTTTGGLDTSFDPGTGADATVRTIAPQLDGTIYVGGEFTSFNGTHRLGFTRLYADGTVDPGFLDTAYNQFAGLHRLYFEKQFGQEPRPAINACQAQGDGNIMIGGAFSQVGGGQADPVVRTDSDYPTANTTPVWLELKGRDGVRNRNNVARLIGGSTAGAGSISLLTSSYTINKSQSYLKAALIRTNGYLGYASANFAVQAGLAAQAGLDYVYNGTAPLYLSSWRPGLLSTIPNANTRSHEDGLFSTNSLPEDYLSGFWYNYLPSLVTISLLPNSNVGDRDSIVTLANPSGADEFFLGGQNMPLGVALGRSSAPFNIVDDSRKTNFLGFATAAFTVNESATNAIITVVRTNSASGSVSVQYTTIPGTAAPGTNYQTVSGVLNFGPGVTTQTFTVPVVDDHNRVPNGLTVGLQLSSPSGTGSTGARLGLGNAILTIVDNDFDPGYVTLAAAAFSTNENSGAVIITVNRSGSNKGTVSVQCGTSDGTALNGVNYNGLTNTLFWNSGDASPRYFTVPLVRDGQPGPNTTFTLRLFNAMVDTTNQPGVLAASPITAAVTIVDDDYYGNLQFSAPAYRVNEHGGGATLTVLRPGGTAQTLTVNYNTVPGTAVSSGALPNFVATSGTLVFNPGDLMKSFTVPILDDGVTNPPPGLFFFTVNLTGLTPAGATLGSPTTATVNILDAETLNVPAGSPDTAFVPSPGFDGDVYSVALQTNGQIIAAGNFTTANNYPRSGLARLNADSSVDTIFLSGQNGQSGANGPVNATLVQTDSRVLAGGAFTTVNGVNRPRLARLLPDGSLDTSFTPGAGADGTVYALVEVLPPGSRQLLVGGSFLHFNNDSHTSLVRLNNDGTVDGGFGSGLSINGAVYAIAVYPTNSIQAGKILIAGDFTTVNGSGYNRIVRLNTDGTLDTTFAPTTGASGTIRALALQVDGRVLAGGSFTNFNGVALNRLARLNVDGSVDGTFNAGAGADDTVSAIVIQPDNRIVLVGQFLHASGVNRSRITRLLPDGTVDPTINFGMGADSFIDTIVLQPDGMFVIGGGFSQFDGYPRGRIARLWDPLESTCRHASLSIL